MAEKPSIDPNKGLRENLITAAIESAKISGLKEEDIDTTKGSPIDIQAQLTVDAIVNFLTQCEFTITQLKANVVIEELKTQPIPINLELETLLGDKAPLLKTLKQIGGLIPGGSQVVEQIVDRLELAIQKAVEPLLEGAGEVPAINITKESGGLEATGYVYIGEDPESQDEFNNEDEAGQRQFTTVKIIKEDIEELL
tara:strand:- start:2692 stop:3282 length:591 start_codon:yes stop_codon:yes gene_type:complete